MKLKESATREEVIYNYKGLANFYAKEEDATEDIHEEKRKLLEEAYEVLREADKRDQYDKIRVPEEETEEVKQKWEKLEREDEGWEAKYQKDRRNSRFEWMIIFGFILFKCWLPSKEEMKKKEEERQKQQKPGPKQTEQQKMALNQTVKKQQQEVAPKETSQKQQLEMEPEKNKMKQSTAINKYGDEWEETTK